MNSALHIFVGLHFICHMHFPHNPHVMLHSFVLLKHSQILKSSPNSLLTFERTFHHCGKCTFCFCSHARDTLILGWDRLPDNEQRYHKVTASSQGIVKLLFLLFSISMDMRYNFLTSDQLQRYWQVDLTTYEQSQACCFSLFPSFMIG